MDQSRTVESPVSPLTKRQAMLPHPVTSGKARALQGNKEPGPHPAHEIGMDGGGAFEAFSGLG